MRGVLIRSMANILGVDKKFKLWQAVLFYAIALGILVLILAVSQTS
jgi:hypothetical protein